MQKKFLVLFIYIFSEKFYQFWWLKKAVKTYKSILKTIHRAFSMISLWKVVEIVKKWLKDFE